MSREIDLEEEERSTARTEIITRWQTFKSRAYDCFWDFEAELADWFGLNTSKYWEELSMKDDFEKEEEARERERENAVGVELQKMEMGD
jgi:hypothetical protein